MTEKRLLEQAAAPVDHEHDQDWLFAQAKERLAAANEAIRTTRTFFFALLSIAAYIGVVVWSTTDEQLLRITPVTLPIIGVEVPLTGFYLFVPWLFVLLHFNLLIHLGLTSRKLKRFLDDLKPLNAGLADRLHNDVANFPLAQWMVGQTDALFRVVLTVLVWILLVLIPPLLLLWMQLRFLAYQDDLMTSLHAAAVAFDAILIVGFRAWFVRKIQPETRWIEGAMELRRRRGLPLGLWLRLIVMQPLFRYLIPLIPLGLAGVLSLALSDLLASETVTPCALGNEPKIDEDVLRYIGWWHCSQTRLSLSGRLLTRGTPSPEVENTLLRADSKKHEEAVERVLGLDLRRRNLVNASFSGAVLLKANLTGSDLRGAILVSAQLDQADLTAAKLQGSTLWGASLVNARLISADLRGAYLLMANLQNADLTGADLRDTSWTEADLQSADLSRANLEESDLAYANLRSADLSDALLQDTNFTGANLQGAILNRAQMTHADLVSANLQGADLYLTQLIGSTLTQADLRGATLDYANVTSANLYQADLTGADLSSADFTGAVLRSAYLENTQLLRANLQDAVLQSAHLDDAWLAVAQLQFANLVDAKLQGANLDEADLAWADLTDADLSFANLVGVTNLETTELAGADYVFADGLEGTILDINQPPPDVLPAP